MNNKTCGECSWFSDNRCNLHNNQYIFGDRPACKDFKRKPTVFETITSSPEVLAEEFVEMMYDRVTGDYRYYSMLTGEFYNNREAAIAATLARLKKVD